MKLQTQAKGSKVYKTRTNTSLGILRNQPLPLGSLSRAENIHATASQAAGVNLPDLNSYGTGPSTGDYANQRTSANLAASSNLLPNPNALLYQHNLCKQQNRERLKDVRNLEDLVNFKVSTIADKFTGANTEQSNTNPNLIQLKQLCDPLLVNRSKPLMKLKSDADDQYEIPQYLTKVPQNYNLFSEFRPRAPENKEEEPYRASQSGKSRRTESGQGQNIAEDLDILNVNRAQFSIDEEEHTLDPVGQLKSYFDEKNKARKLHKARAKLAGQKSLMQQRKINETSAPEITNEKNFQSFNRLKTNHYGLHPNYVIAKYEKMAKDGKLEIKNQPSQEENQLFTEYNSYVELQEYNKQMLAENEMKRKQLADMAQYNQIQQQLQDVSTLLSGYQNAPAQESYLMSSDEPQPEGSKEGQNQPENTADQATAAAANLGMLLRSAEDDGASTLQPQHTTHTDGGDTIQGHININPQYDFNPAQNDYQEQILNMQAISQAASKDELQKFSKMVQKDFIGSSLQNGLVEQQIHAQQLARMENLHKSQDEMIQDKLMQILQSRDQDYYNTGPYSSSFDPKDNLMGSSDKVSATRYSELNKYQNVRTCGIGKGYVNYTDEQIQLAQRLKNLEQKHSNAAKRTAPGVARAQSQQAILNQEMKKMRSINKIKKLQDDQRTSEINYRGSLPQLKNALEKKKVSVQQIPRKAFKEDQQNQSLRYTFNNELVDQVKTADNSDYVASNLAVKPRQTFGNKSQDFQRKNNRINLKNQLRLNNDMQGIQTNNQSSQYISQRGNRLNESSEQAAAQNIKRHILPQAQAILNATDSNSFHHETNLDKTERTPLVEAVGSSRSESIHIQGATDHDQANIFQESPEDKSHTPKNEAAQTAAEAGKAMVMSSSECLQQVRGTTKIGDATINVGLTSQLILNQEGFDTTFNVVDTNRLDKTNEGSEYINNNKFSATDAEQADEVEIYDVKEDPSKQVPSSDNIAQSSEVVNIKMLDQDYTGQKDILSSQEKQSTQARKSIYSNQKSRDKLDMSESKSAGRPYQVANAATSNAGAYQQSVGTGSHQPTSGVVTMSITQTQLEANPFAVEKVEPPATIKSTQRQISKQNKLQPREGGLTENLTGRTGQTYTGTVYINESANNSQGFLRVQGQHKQVDARPKMKTHINFNQKKGKDKIPLDDLENQYSNNYQQKSENAQKVHKSSSNIRKYIAQQLRQKTPLFEMSDRGYHSSNDPYMDKISADMYDQIIEDHIVRRGCWIPQRFKKFPRFIIFTQKDDLQDKDHLTSQFISLNPQVLALLASSDVNNINHLNEVLDEPIVTKRSQNISQNQNTHSQSKIVQNSMSHTLENSPSKTPQTQNFGSKKVSLKIEKNSNDSPTQQLDFDLNEVKNAKGGEGDFYSLQEAVKLEQYVNEDNIPAILYQALLLVCQGQFQPEEVLQMLDSQTMQKLLVAANQPTATIEDLKDQILNLLISKVKQFDPFDKVLLTKNIDNQILTSFRTLNKSNNMMSNTLKVVHQRFMPKNLGKNIKNKVPKSKVLYALNNDIYDPLELQKKVDGMNEDERSTFIKQFQMTHTFDILEKSGNLPDDLKESLDQINNMTFTKSERDMDFKGTQPLEDNIIKSIIDSKEERSDFKTSQEKLRLGMDQQLIDSSTIELIKNRGESRSKSPKHQESHTVSKKTISIPYGSSKKLPPYQMQNIKIVGISEDQKANLSLQCQTQQDHTLQSDDRSLHPQKKIISNASQLNKITTREQSKEDSSQIELQLGQGNSHLGGTETERAIEGQISARQPLVQQPTQSSGSVSMVPTPNNPLHGHVGKKTQNDTLKQQSLEVQKINDGTTSDYNEIRDSPLESVICENKEGQNNQTNNPSHNISRQLYSQKIQSTDEPIGLSQSDFTFLFNQDNKHHSREQMNPWSKNNSISKQSIDILNTEFGIPQITGLKINARGEVDTTKSNDITEEINLKINVKNQLNIKSDRKVEPQIQKIPSKTNLEYTTDSIQIEIQTKPGAKNLKQKSKKFGAGFNAGLGKSNGFEAKHIPEELLFRMATKDGKSRTTRQGGNIYLNNVTNVNDIQHVITAMASETYRKQMMSTSESAVIGGGIDQIGLTREGLQIKKIINEIYRNLNKYQKRQADRDDFVTSKQLIFDNSKARALVDQQKEPVITNKERRQNLDYAELVQQNEYEMLKSQHQNDGIIGINVSRMSRR